MKTSSFENQQFDAVLTKNLLARDVRQAIKNGDNKASFTTHDLKTLREFLMEHGTNKTAELVDLLKDHNSIKEAFHLLEDIEKETGESNQPCIFDIITCRQFDL